MTTSSIPTSSSATLLLLRLVAHKCGEPIRRGFPNSKDREKYTEDLAQARSGDRIFGAIFVPLFLWGSYMTYVTKKERLLVGRFGVPAYLLIGAGTLSIPAGIYRFSSTREVRKAWTDKYGKEPFYRRALRTSIGHSLFAKLGQMEHELDRFFDGFQPQLRDHVAQLTMSDSGELSYKVDVSGFRSEEVNVKVKGNEIVVEGEHREQKQGESVHRQFSRRVLIPEGIQKESIKCKLDAGRLCITGMKTTGYERRSIPIEVKKAID
uniref:SHSP domain-containing protein n=1 Tax=Globodera pallida TaxID=36090 RepID=A0A183CII0_GLOPA